MFRTEPQWVKAYERKHAYWERGQNPLQPHAVQTSGNHTDRFFNSRPVIDDEKLLREAASDLVDLFVQNNGDLKNIDRVVGPGTGATRLSEFIADEISHRQGRKCTWASPTKYGEGAARQMVFNNPERRVQNGEVVLRCEDVVSTGLSIDLTLRAIIQRGGIATRYVLALVNRSGMSKINGYDIVSLISRPASMWIPQECPLCAQGSEALHPKIPENWARLTAKY